MTVIEFFDRESAVENIASALICKPEKVVFIGSNAKRMKKCVENYNSVLQARGIEVDFSFRTVGRNNLGAIVSAIEDVVSENGECKIDIGGGDELFLVAVGTVLEKHKDKVEIRRFNVNNNYVSDCNSDGCVLKKAVFNLGVDENIRIYGGRVIYSNEKANSTVRWDFNNDFVSDIKAMWEICRKNAGAWNAQANTVSKLCNECFDESDLRISVKSERIQKGIFISKEIFSALEECGVIKDLQFGERFSFRFKNKNVMKCITKAGLLLELIITVIAKDLKDGDGYVYNDVGTGVYIDWDGVVNGEGCADVENEMDVILMKGMIPVFISCKNGAVDSDELYKLSVVSERFGGKYVKKVLIATRLDEMGYKAEYIRARAKDMGIRVVENIDTLNEKELCETVAKFTV